MRSMSIAVVAAVAALAASPALSSDLLSPMTHAAEGYDWSGFYVGIVAGGGQFSSTTTEHGNSIYGGGASQSEIGGTVGGTVGFNIQNGAAVFGVEGDLSWSSFGFETTYPDLVNENNSSWDWLATVRARAGLAVDNALIYATAGVAAVSTDYFYGRNDLLTGMYAESSGTELGFTAGVGAEYAFSDDLSVKAEYLFVSPTSTTATTDFSELVDFSSSAHIARVGVNLHF